MSKSVGKLLGAGNNSTKQFQSEAEYINFLRNYNTKDVDSTYKNMASTANSLSSTLGNRPDYIYAVDGSDAAQKRAEQAMFNQTVATIAPEFDARRRQLETRLQNQGFAPTSEAYQSAMNSLENQQNSAYINAANNSILAGQEAYSNSLNNQIAAANFQNSARQLPINELANLLQNQHSNYDVANQIYGVASGRDSRINTAHNQNATAQFELGKNFLVNAGQLYANSFSDEALKENIIPVGKLYNGLTVYLFTYKGDNEPRIGLMAQEVLPLHPQAVTIDKSGYLKINYMLACC